MTDADSKLEWLRKLVEAYESLARGELNARIEAWPPNIAIMQQQEVILGLLGRQVTLACHLANSPGTWTGHIAPIVLRSMTDVYITMAWIMKSPAERSERYVLYGLGQEKLFLEHYKAALQKRGVDPTTDERVRAWEQYLNAQRATFLTEVDVGSFAGVDTRKMAEEADCLELYRFAYAPFSSSTHSTWQHVSKYNLHLCSNPLHGIHRVASELDIGIDPDYMYRAAKYVRKTFQRFDSFIGVVVQGASAFEQLIHDLKSEPETPPEWIWEQAETRHE